MLGFSAGNGAHEGTWSMSGYRAERETHGDGLPGASALDNWGDVNATTETEKTGLQSWLEEGKIMMSLLGCPELVPRTVPGTWYALSKYR